MQKDKILKDVTESYKDTHVFPDNITILADENDNNYLYLQHTKEYGFTTIEKIIDHIPYSYLLREDEKYCFDCSWYSNRQLCCTNVGCEDHNFCWRGKED